MSVPYGRLRNSNIPELLREMGASDAVIQRLLISFGNIPARWRSQMEETKPEERARRHALATKCKRLAAEFDNDPEASVTGLSEIRQTTDSYEIHLTKARSRHWPSLADLLRQIAEGFTESPGYSLAMTRRVKLDVYAVRSVYVTLRQAGFIKEDRQWRKRVCGISSVILGKRINENSVSKDPVLTELRNMRRNWKMVNISS